MPIWPAASSTIFRTPATFWNAPARGKPRRASRWARWPKHFSHNLALRVLSHVIGVGEARLGRGGSWEELVALSQKEEVLLGCVDAGSRSAHEGSCRPRLSHRRHRGRRLRSGGARTCRPAWARTSPGIRGWMAVWRRPSCPCRR